MALVRVNPSRSSRSLALVEPEPLHLTSWFEDLDRFVNEVWARPYFLSSDHIHPDIDLFEDEKDLVLRAELPGVKKNDIDISFQNGCLTIKAEKKTAETKGDEYMRERFYGRYTRSLTLPMDVDEAKITSTYSDGVLEVRLPKTEEVKSKKIDIKVK